jgi:methyl-accepting chemotaxis protein-1 (serine sensor receptor)
MKRPTIKVALVFMLSLITVAVLGLSIASIRSLASLNADTNEIGTFWMQRLVTARDVKGGANMLGLAYARELIADTAKEQQEELKFLASTTAELDAAVDVYEKGVRTERGRQLIEVVKADTATYRQMGERLVQLHNAGKKADAVAFFKQDMSKQTEKVNASVDELVAFIVGKADSFVKDSQATYNTTFLLMAALSGLTLLIALGAIYFSVSGIANPIRVIASAMNRLSSGDTASEIPFAGRADEVGEMAAAVEVFRLNAINATRLDQEAEAARSQAEALRAAAQKRAEHEAEQLRFATASLGEGLKRLASGDMSMQVNETFAAEYEPLRQDFNASLRQLGSTIGAVLETVSSMDNGTREIASGAQDLSKRTEQQAASLEETAAALDEITANVGTSTKRTEEARSVAAQANQSAVKSAAVVSEAEKAMRRIEESSQQISNIIGVIDEIAFQTNLLALNAGVEAARAGEAGKGFAVVAQEVRELAQRSAQAAKEIKGLIQNSSTEVDNGVKLVRETGVALGTIGDHVVQINQLVEAIATSAREQSTGLAEVNTAVNQMDQTTQQNAAMVEQSTAASASLASEATRLRELVNQFKLDGSVTQASALRAIGGAMARSTSAAKPQAGAPMPARASAAGHARSDSWEEF